MGYDNFSSPLVFFVILQSIKEKNNRWKKISDVETDMSYVLRFLGFYKEKNEEELMESEEPRKWGIFFFPVWFSGLDCSLGLIGW